MTDLLDKNYIDSLPQPFFVDSWPVHDIDVQTGLFRINVCGLLDVRHIGEVIIIIDAHGTVTFQKISTLTQIVGYIVSREETMTEWREELIEAIAKAAWESDGTREWKRVNEPFRKFWLRNIRTALAIAEPVIATGFREGVAVGSMTGVRGDRVIIDDLHSVDPTQSAAIREGGAT